MKEKLSSFVNEWWWGWALSSITNFPAVVTIFSIVSAIILFFILRWQYRNWSRMWALDGLEVFGAAGAGALVTGSFYFLPVMLIFAVGAAIVMAIFEVLSQLVILSCGGKKNERG